MLKGTYVGEPSEGHLYVLSLAYLFCSVWVHLRQMNAAEEVLAAVLVEDELKVSGLELLDDDVLSEVFLELLGLLLGVHVFQASDIVEAT